MLASDDFEGRAPGTEGERRTIAYIVEQFRARGLEPAGENGTWLQPVGLVERRPGTADAQLDRPRGRRRARRGRARR